MVILVNFFNFLGFTFIMPFLPLYVQELGVDSAGEIAFWTGFAIGVTPLCSATMAPFWGATADRFGRKAIFEIGLFFLSALWVALSLVSNVYQLAALRMFWGFLGGVSALATAMVTLNGPPEQMSRGLGLIQASQFAAYAVGPAAGGFIADRLGLRQSLYIPAVMVMAGIVLTHLVYREAPVAKQHRSKARRTGVLRQLLGMPMFVPIIAVLFLAQWVDKSFTVIIPLFVASVENATTGMASLSGLIISLGAIAATISAATVGRLAVKRAPTRLLALSLAAGLLVSAPMAFADSSWQMGVLRIALGLLAGGTTTLAYTVAGLSLPSESRATALGVLSSAYLFGSALSPMVGGALIGVGMHVPLLLNVVLYALALSLMIAVPRIRPQGDRAAGDVAVVRGDDG